jgi:hypothetical protein
VAHDRPDVERARVAQAREDALRLAEGVPVEHASPPVVGVGAPPRGDVVEGLARRLPAVDRQPERRLGDEHVAAQRLERRAGRVGIGLVVARHDPHAACVLEPHLRGAENVAGRVQRHRHAVLDDPLAVADRVERDVGAEPRAQDALGVAHGEVACAARARVVAVRVGDDGPVDRSPGIDVEAARRAVQPLGPRND